MDFSNQMLPYSQLRRELAFCLGPAVVLELLEISILENRLGSIEGLKTAYVYEFLVYWLKCRYPNYC